jgi:arylsulfatase
MQLYDITTDVREEHDLAAEHPEVVAAMWRAIKESHSDVENPRFKLNITYPADK